MFDLVVRNGVVVDGTGEPARRADIGISGGRIAGIGTIPAGAAKQEIDAQGLVVAPGFIDLHTHYDAQLFWDPYCTLKPGATMSPQASITSSASPAPIWPISTMRPSLMPMSAENRGLPEPSTTVPPRITVSSAMFFSR